MPGGVPGPGGVYLVWGEGCTWSGGVPGLGGVHGPRGVYLVWGCTWSQGGVPCPGGVPGPGGVYLVWGVPGPGGVYLVPGGPGQVLPPMDRITDACKNITLPQLRCGR